nr:PREDICTED: ran GTPase-activating protein 1 [Bemisia tabaci]
MSNNDSVGDLEKLLKQTTIAEGGISFAGRGLKLDTEDDAKEVVDAIEQCEDLSFFNMEGNTLGVDAAKAIAKALEKHKEFKRALWKDMFTGRMKSEIPLALKHLGGGMLTAGARLVELDLSDNALGPIGVEGLADFLRSTCCYNLQELRLNNNGLGVTGTKMLAKALLDCHKNSSAEGKPLALKIFIAGRNRIENEGALKLAEVFKTIGTLEEIAMPQNGIYHVGISALSDAFRANPNLRIINLNDNTITEKGAVALAKAFLELKELKILNFGDCLLRTKGAILLANALEDTHQLEELILDSNEIGQEGGEAVAKAVSNKLKLKALNLNSNNFGENGIEVITNALKESGHFEFLSSLSDDEGTDDEEEDGGGGDGEDDEDENSEAGSASDSEPTATEVEQSYVGKPDGSEVKAGDFLCSPTAENFTALGPDSHNLFIKEAEAESEDKFLDIMLPALMKVASLSVHNESIVKSTALTCSQKLYQYLMEWGAKNNQLSLITNSILVHLGFLKSEDKKFKVNYNLDGCLNSLNKALEQPFFPASTKEVILVFLGRNDLAPNLQMKRHLDKKAAEGDRSKQ